MFLQCDYYVVFVLNCVFFPINVHVFNHFPNGGVPWRVFSRKFFRITLWEFPRVVILAATIVLFVYFVWWVWFTFLLILYISWNKHMHLYRGQSAKVRYRLFSIYSQSCHISECHSHSGHYTILFYYTFPPQPAHYWSYRAEHLMSDKLSAVCC